MISDSVPKYWFGREKGFIVPWLKTGKPTAPTQSEIDADFAALGVKSRPPAAEIPRLIVEIYREIIEKNHALVSMLAVWRELNKRHGIKRWTFQERHIDLVASGVLRRHESGKYYPVPENGVSPSAVREIERG